MTNYRIGHGIIMSQGQRHRHPLLTKIQAEKEIIMKIVYASHTIELTKAEASKASKPGSNLYNELNEIRKEFPTFKIVINTTKKKTAKNSSIKYEDMERYISFHDDEEHSIMREFNARRHAKENGALNAQGYFEIKKWFFEVFPDAA